jgi:hypothetical protein
MPNGLTSRWAIRHLRSSSNSGWTPMLMTRESNASSDLKNGGMSHTGWEPA